MAKDCDGAGLRNETMDHGVTASGRQARDSTLSERGAVSTMFIQEHTTATPESQHTPQGIPDWP
jgi:hypothetical protein